MSHGRVADRDVQIKLGVRLRVLHFIEKWLQFEGERLGTLFPDLRAFLSAHDGPHTPGYHETVETKKSTILEYLDTIKLSPEPVRL